MWNQGKTITTTTTTNFKSSDQPQFQLTLMPCVCCDVVIQRILLLLFSFLQFFFKTSIAPFEHTHTLRYLGISLFIYFVSRLFVFVR